MGSIVGRRTYTTTNTDSNGHTTTTTHYRVTWQRADGSRQARDVSSGFYSKAKEGQPAELRLWQKEVVGVEVMGDTQWFLPESGAALNNWLRLAFFGVGVLLWGLFFGRWDGLFMLAFRTISWMFMSFPLALATDYLAYGMATGVDLVADFAFAFCFTGFACAILFSTLFEIW